MWTQPQGDDERAIKAIGKAFEEANPGVEFKLLVISEDTYATKVNTALQAKAPPDVAALEDRTWMQAGKVVQLDDKLVEWGVDVTDFNPGGIGRGTPKGTLEIRSVRCRRVPRRQHLRLQQDPARSGRRHASAR